MINAYDGTLADPGWPWVREAYELVDRELGDEREVERLRGLVERVATLEEQAAR